MFVERRKAGKRVKYYAVHSYREAGEVRKTRRFLGYDLTKERLAALLPIAEEQAVQREHARRVITDPLLAAITPEELKLLKGLEREAGFKVFHLSEGDWRRFSEMFTYNTNAIEGSQLTQAEVERVLEKGEWPADRGKGDIAEAYGVDNAIKLIRETREHVSTKLIKELHRTVFRNSKPFAGDFRKKGQEVVVLGANGAIAHRGAPSHAVPSLLEELAGWYGKNKRRYPGIILAAVVHNQFENIHPFADGNGRVGRLLLNNVLIKHGLPPVNIDFARRGEYYAALQAYDNSHDIRPTIELLLSEYKELRKRLGKG
jgi:Fic family protein